MLGAHEAIAAAPETYFDFRIASLADYYGDLADPVRLRRVIQDTIQPPVPIFDEDDFDLDELMAAVQSRGPSYPAVLDAVLTAFAQRRGKRRWSEKSPGQKLARAWELFPTARAIHIVRDPRDTVASQLRAPFGLGSATEVAKRWRTHTSDAMGLGDGDERYFRLTYRDLVRDPEHELRAVCEFLGETFDANMLDPERRLTSGTLNDFGMPWQEQVGDPVHQQSVGRHRETLPVLDRVRVEAVTHHLMGPLGFAGPPAWPRVIPPGLVARLVRERDRSRTDQAERLTHPEARASTSPADHYEAVQAWMQRARRSVSSTEARQGDPSER